MKRFVITSLFIMLFIFLSNTGNQDNGLTTELSFTPNPPAITENESLVIITGVVAGESINIKWDFSSAGFVATNGLMSSQISSTIMGTASLYFDNDFNQTDYTQTNSDWYLRFTLGNASYDYQIYNSKKDFAIPYEPYCLITLRKGRYGTEFREAYYNESNLMSAMVTEFIYDEENNTLRLAGGIKSTWGEDWVQADFNILMGGPDDRQKSLNQSTFKNSFE